MRRLVEWVTGALPARLSEWMLGAYRRPLPVLLGLVVLPLALLLFATSAVSISLWRQQALSHLRVSARLAAEIVDETLGESLHLEEMVAAQTGFADAVAQRNGAELRRRLDEALAFLPRVDLVLVLTPEGELLAEAPARPAGATPVAGFAGALREAQDGGWHSQVSAVYLREGPEIEKVVGLLLPVVRDGAVVGVLQFQHRVEEIKSWLQKIRVEPQGFLYVVDHHDQLVVYPYQVLPGKPKVVSDWPPVSMPLESSGATQVFRDAKTGAPWLAGVYPVADTGWRVVAVQPQAAALRVLYRVLGFLGGMVVVLGLLLVLVSLRWAKLQQSSLRLLQQNTKMLRQLQQQETLKRLQQPPDKPSSGGAV